jgi:hypothetical protein
MEKEEHRFVVKFFWLQGWGPKKIHQELMSTPGDDAPGLSQIKILGRCSELGIFHAVIFLVRDDSSLWYCRLKHFSKVTFRKFSHNREALPDDCFYSQRNSSERIGDEKILAALGPHSLNDPQEVAHVETAKEMLRILQE